VNDKFFYEEKKKAITTLRFFYIKKYCIILRDGLSGINYLGFARF
jgi:hypothetical protein